ncbi:MAG: hypothetical protein SGJ20_08265 [Planctomycetota bacterium]|nr:hypothetical protein [Planctomycetota bacterium]
MNQPTSKPNTGGTSPVVQPASTSKSSPANAAGGAKGVADDSFVFLCPNGHKLNGPRRMAGKVGQCPHCGTRFQIPTTEEISAADVASRPVHDDDDDAIAVPADLTDLFTGGHTKYGAHTTERSDTGSDAGRSVRPFSQSSTGQESGGYYESDNYRGPRHPLAELVTRLWVEREHGGVIELYLSGGVMLAPDWFDENLSRQTHGLFATHAADGTVTMTVVPWETITRVVVRGVVGLPDGMFE